MMKLKKNAQLKRRYLLIEASSKDSIEKAILDYIGILGWADAAPHFVSNRPVILAVNRDALDKVRGAFALVKGIRVLKVSGTLNGLGIKLK